MTLYAIFDPKPGRLDPPLAVAEKFNWLAAVLPPVFLLLNRLWLETLGWVLGLAALVLLTAYLGGGTSFCLYVLGAVWLGFAAPSLRRHALEARGWRYRGERIAMGPDLAQLEAIR